MTTEIAEYSATEAALSTLANHYEGVVYDVTTRDGMGEAVKARAELRGFRIDLEKTRKAIKEPALRRAQAIDSEARRITFALLALEEPIDEQIKTETEKKKRAEEAAAKAEAERIAAEELARKQAEEAKLAAERAEIEKAKAALAEQERQSRLKIEEEQRASRMEIEAEERAARAAREESGRQERLARQAREEVKRVRRAEEEAKLKAEREKIEAERRAAEEAQRKVREAEEAAKREKLRLANELNDGYEMLATFVRRFGKREEFREIVKAIGPYLRKVA